MKHKGLTLDHYGKHEVPDFAHSRQSDKNSVREESFIITTSADTDDSRCDMILRTGRCFLDEKECDYKNVEDCPAYRHREYRRRISSLVDKNE